MIEKEQTYNKSIVFMKKVLYITSFFEEDFKPIGIRIHNIKEYLSRNFDLQFIGNTNVEWYSRIRKSSAFWDHLIVICGKISEVLFIECAIVWFKILFYTKVLRKRYDIFFVQVRPFSLLCLSAYIKREFPSAVLCVDMTDPILINVKYDKYPDFRKKQLQRLENQLMYVDYLVVLDNKIKEYYKDKISMKGEVVVIEQGTDKCMYSCQKYEKKHLGIKLLYAGKFYPEIRDPFNLYKAIDELENIRFDIYGQISPCYLQFCSDRICYKGLINHKSLSEKYQECDMIVYIDNKSDYQVPGKLYEILSTDKPILFVTDIPDSPASISAKKYEGVFFCKNEVGDIVSVISKTLPVLQWYYKRDCSDFSWEILLERFAFLK